MPLRGDEERKKQLYLAVEEAMDDRKNGCAPDISGHFAITLIPADSTRYHGEWVWDVCPEDDVYMYYVQGRAKDICKAAETAYAAMQRLIEEALTDYQSRNGIVFAA